MFQRNDEEKIKTWIFVQFFFLLNHAVYEIMWKNMLQPDRLQMTIQYGASELHAGWLNLETHTQNI